MNEFDSDTKNSRRDFIVKAGIYITATSLSGSLLSCSDSNEKEENTKEEKEIEVTPTEDLMREHGILNRVLLIYDDCILKLKSGVEFSPEILNGGASIIREFIEDYHEKEEENILFPRFIKADKLKDLVHILKQQHVAGRLITDKINHLSKGTTFNKLDKKSVIEQLESFLRMYRPHEAREDTVLFPAFKTIVSKNEYDSLGEEMEKNEHKLFGQDGFKLYVEKVTDLEKKLGINDLNQFTPK